MLKLIAGRFKRIVSVLALACFLCNPLGYVATAPTASAASYGYDSRHDDYRDRDYRHDRDKRHDKDDDDEDYTKGNIVTAVLVGGVIGAIIAKNT